MAISVESRLRGALWGMFSGDALASPTHWYYGGPTQIRADYGTMGTTDYTKPSHNLSGSIMNKSSTTGGGRGSFNKRRMNNKSVSIIGDVINHGKLDLWDPSKSIHYHATLQAGENTLEGQLVRVLMRSIVANKGNFNADHFRKSYVAFMTTPNSHNDAYASTCHRMFFANYIYKSLPPEQCPDNDEHNVDAIDGLVLPTIVSLAEGAKMLTKSKSSSAVVSRDDDETKWKAKARDEAANVVAVTRKSLTLEKYSRAWSDLVIASLQEKDDVGENGANRMTDHLNNAARQMGLRRLPRSDERDEMCACYLSQSVPTTLDIISKYLPFNDAWTGLIANANVGGENVHRGAVLGAILGARAGVERLPKKMIDGLYSKAELAEEIEAFVKAVTSDPREKEL